MKKLLTIAIVTIACCMTANSYTPAEVSAAEGTVYVCTGPQSHKYHKTPNCKGLRKCSTEILELTVEQARDKGYKPCKLCYGRE